MSEDFDELCRQAIEAFNALPIEEQRAQMRAQAINFAYGNLALAGSKATREDCERAYDRLHGGGA